MVENLRKMQELRAQIQAQLKLADTLKKLNENAGEDNHYSVRCGKGGFIYEPYLPWGVWHKKPPCSLWYFYFYLDRDTPSHVPELTHM